MKDGLSNHLRECKIKCVSNKKTYAHLFPPKKAEIIKILKNI